ncbi:MAG: hypothetical protein ABH840_01355 [Nanoarchaeota archaeon]
MVNENYKLKLKDFIPVEGIMNYQRRNNLTVMGALTNVRNLTLALYNGSTAVGLGLIICEGLEALMK